TLFQGNGLVVQDALKLERSERGGACAAEGHADPFLCLYSGNTDDRIVDNFQLRPFHGDIRQLCGAAVSQDLQQELPLLQPRLPAEDLTHRSPADPSWTRQDRLALGQQEGE